MRRSILVLALCVVALTAHAQLFDEAAMGDVPAALKSPLRSPTGAITPPPPAPSVMALAAYANVDYDHNRVYGGYTSADYDSMATNSLQVIGSELFRPVQYVNFTDVCEEVHARNPDAVVLAYLSVYGILNGYSLNPETDPMRRLWDLTDRMGGWAKTLDHEYEYSWNESHRVLNFAFPADAAFPDSFAREAVNALALCPNGQDGMGFFMDWFNEGKWPSWAVNVDSLDLDQNGIAHAYDTDEQEAYVTGNSKLLQALRTEFQAQLGEQRVLILNGGDVMYEPEYTPYVDGTMWENLHDMGLSSVSKWVNAAASADIFYKGNYDKGVSMADARGDSVFYRMEAIGLLLESNGAIAPYDMHGSEDRIFCSLKNFRDAPLEMGRPTGAMTYDDAPISINRDTLRRDYDGGSVAISFVGTAEKRWSTMEYLILDENDDVLSRYGFPAANPSPEAVSYSVVGTGTKFTAVVEADYCSNASFSYRVDSGSTIYLSSTSNGYIHTITDRETGANDGDEVDVYVSLYNCDEGNPGASGYIGSFTAEILSTTFPKYRSITIPSSLCDDDIALLPVAVEFIDPTLRSYANGGNVNSDDGADIWFSATSGSLVEIPFEIEKYDPVAGYLLAWMGTSISSSKNTVRYLRYGDDSIVVSREDPDALWVDYSFVMHMETEEAFTTNDDVTIVEEGNGISRTTNGALAGAQTLAYEGAIRIDDVDISGVFDNGATGFTIEALTYVTTGGSSGYSAVLHHADLDGLNGLDFTYIAPGSSHHDYSLRLAGFGSPRPFDSETPVGSAPMNDWNFLVGIYSGTLGGAYSYVNGVMLDSDMSAIDPYACSRDFARIGMDGRHLPPDFGGWAGRIDEVRFSKIPFPAGRISTQWNNYSDPGAFAVIGSEN